MLAETVVRRWRAAAGRVDLGTDQLDIDRRVYGPLLYRFGRCPCILAPPRTVAWDCSSVTVRHTSA